MHEWRWGRCTENVTALDAVLKLLFAALLCVGTPALRHVHEPRMWSPILHALAQPLLRMWRRYGAPCWDQRQHFMLRERKSAVESDIFSSFRIVRGAVYVDNEYNLYVLFNGV